ncbi:hypothetical protein QUB80_12960 [Chlorogloeopsis sp. ULAP01]|uniref:hypothetical protein n=1 Tax=Chlorogloeopsis sp. ULAP01 TaxID=3056483 RepID=UPI0025AB14C8|nr:hypothetical protein [Chlorogloeopsis sp. ULAP01]MDM9381611.1 hypothetical protein [Chlorogloeopsis sp. ULAP01]
MNTHTFDHHYVTCPICQKHSTTKSVQSYIGLFTCPYCQERLVVCKSGHYVRDPFNFKQIAISSALRRQSRPLARIIRDFVIPKHPIVALIVGSAVVFGMIAINQQSTNNDLLPLPIEEITEQGKKSQ